MSSVHDKNLLSENEIVRIAGILSSDFAADEKKDQIYGELGLPLAELRDLKQSIFIDRSGPYGFFAETLSKYHLLKQGTVKDLVDCFEKLSLTRVVDQITQKLNAKSESIWFAIEKPVRTFTGRETELKKLHTLLTKYHFISISGLGGVGKSELARKYATDYREYYEGNAIWINAETQESFSNSLIDLATSHLNLSAETAKSTTDTEILKIVYHNFSRQNQKCLIIIDNIEKFDISTVLPNILNPTIMEPNILITSRHNLWKYDIKVLKDRKSVV